MDIIVCFSVAALRVGFCSEQFIQILLLRIFLEIFVRRILIRDWLASKPDPSTLKVECEVKLSSFLKEKAERFKIIKFYV